MLKGRAVYKPSCCIQLSKKKKNYKKQKLKAPECSEVRLCWNRAGTDAWGGLSHEGGYSRFFPLLPGCPLGGCGACKETGA